MRPRQLVFALVTLAAISFAPVVADAQAGPPTPTVIYDAVTSYTTFLGTAGIVELSITGVQHGASASSTQTFGSDQTSSSPQNAILASCERQLLVTINRPGRFSLGVYVTGSLAGCTLTQLP